MKINDQRAHNQLQEKKSLDPVDLAAIVAALNNTEDWKGLPSSEQPQETPSRQGVKGGVSREVGGVMNVLLDDGNEIGRYKGVKMWQNQMRVKAPILRHLLHMWLTQIPSATNIANNWCSTRFWYDSSVGMMRYVPSNNTDGTRKHPAMRPTDLLFTTPNFHRPFVPPRIPPGRDLRHSLEEIRKRRAKGAECKLYNMNEEDEE